MPRVDYSKEHYCQRCEKKFPLTMFRCDEPTCRGKLRITPRKQKREIYVPVTEDRYLHTATEIRNMVQCKTTYPREEKRI